MGQNPKRDTTEWKRAKSEADARKAETCVFEPLARPTKSTEEEGNIQSIVASSSSPQLRQSRNKESQNNIILVLLPLSLEPIQAPATDDVEHANAERSVERLLLERNG